MDFTKASVREITTAIKSKKISAVEVTKHYLARSNELNSKYNAYITINDQALSQAKKIDEAILRGEDPGFLAGLPIAVKDLFCTKGIKTTAASKILSNFVPPYTATCVQKLLDQGAVVVGKTNMDEFAMGSSNETSFFGAVKNPWDAERVPGGSSGGSAAAVAGGMAPTAIGSDTGGSIRQPASFSGLVGVKPTYGRISRYGMIAFASSLDQAGPMTKSVEDSIYLLDAMCGHDAKDSTSSQKTWTQLHDKKDLKTTKLKVGLPKEYFEHKLEDAIKESFWGTVDKLKEAGVEFVDVSLPNMPHAVPVYYMVATSEASSNLSRYDGIRYGFRSQAKDDKWSSLEELYSTTRSQGFGDEVKRRILLGTFALSSGYFDAYYLKASQVRRMIRDDFTKAYQQCDLILSPVVTTSAFKIGARIDDPMEMYLNDIFTTSVNLAGIPGMSVPVGLNKEGLPLGIQIMAPHFAEEKMLGLALTIEEVSGFLGRSANVAQ